MIKRISKTVGVYSALIYLALCFSLPVYTHFFDLFSYLVDEKGEDFAQVDCSKNGVIAVARPGPLCIHRSYSLAMGTPPFKEHEEFLELMEKDFLPIETCDCVIASGQRLKHPEPLFASNLSWGGQQFAITEWYCVSSTDNCGIL